MKDRDHDKTDFHRLGVYEDWHVDGLHHEWWAGEYPERGGRWFCRRLVVSPVLLRMRERGDPLDRQIQAHVDALDRTPECAVPQGGRHQFTRDRDGARIVRQPFMSLN